MKPLSPKRRSELRAQAHKLSPVVIIGDKGLTDEVLAEVDRSLTAHELIKVRAASGAREARDAWLEAICARLGAHPVQQIGKVLVVYRESPEEKPRRPAAGPRAGGTDARVGRGRNAGPRQQAKAGGRRQGEDKGSGLRRGAAAAAKPKTGLRRARATEALPAALKRTSRPRSRTPSPLPESGLRRRRRSTSR